MIWIPRAMVWVHPLLERATCPIKMVRTKIAWVCISVEAKRHCGKMMRATLALRSSAGRPTSLQPMQTRLVWEVGVVAMLVVKKWGLR